jgi:RNA polymerase subunit RPABC4/transcription elongation factor Spt4
MGKLCKNCFTNNLDESKFCSNCGSPLNGDVGTQNIAQTTDQNKITCPMCGSSDIHFVTIQSSQNFDRGDACCGYLLCGPLGLLFGVKDENESRTVRKCMFCNHEF